MESAEGQRANARGENNAKIKRAVVASLSCPPGGLQRANKTKEKYAKTKKKKKKKN